MNAQANPNAPAQCLISNSTMKGKIHNSFDLFNKVQNMHSGKYMTTQ